MPLKVVVRKQTGSLAIDGWINGKRYQRKPQSDRLALAREEAAAWEAEILRTAWHGPKDSAVQHTLDQALEKYLEAEPRSNSTKARLARLRAAIGAQTPLPDINQDTITKLRNGLFSGAAESTILREGIVPLRAVLTIAVDLKWCDPVKFKTPKLPEGRTVFFMPSQAELLISAAARHLQELLPVLFCTGMRLSEAIYLDWRDVDLVGAHIILWPDRTKAKKRRNIALPPRAVAALANLPHRDGMVFRHKNGEPYADRDGFGGQIKKAWEGARRRAGLSAELTPHSARHSWASWHYAIHRDPMLLKFDGGWSSLDQVERYAHLMPAGHEAEIRQFRGENQGVVGNTRTPLVTIQ